MTRDGLLMPVARTKPPDLRYFDSGSCAPGRRIAQGRLSEAKPRLIIAMR